MQNNKIQTRPRPYCPICGSAGDLLYRGLIDQIFNAPGAWDMRKCDKIECGTLWLNPMPIETELPKLYTGYYTHKLSPPPSPNPVLRAFLDQVRVAYLYDRFGYKPQFAPRMINRLLGWMAYLHPAWKDTLEASVFYLEALRGGCLLEVGCGNGTALKSMQKKGWSVTGVDFDEEAVKNARNKGLDVRHGQLSAQRFADDSFDAVVMSHVIEHVPLPGELLRECRRVLKKGGTLIVLTPNADSRGHTHYGRCWRGLEPPRHLQVFTTRSLASLAREAGYDTVESFTSMQGAVYIWYASGEMLRSSSHNMNDIASLNRRIFLQITGLAIGWLHVLLPGHGEVNVIMCKK